MKSLLQKCFIISLIKPITIFSVKGFELTDGGSKSGAKTNIYKFSENCWKFSASKASFNVFYMIYCIQNSLNPLCVQLAQGNVRCVIYDHLRKVLIIHILLWKFVCSSGMISRNPYLIVFTASRKSYRSCGLVWIPANFLKNFFFRPYFIFFLSLRNVEWYGHRSLYELLFN